MTEKSRFWDGTTTGDATESPYDAGTEFAAVLMLISNTQGFTDKGGVWRDDLLSLEGYSSAANTLRVRTGRAMVYGSWYQSDANVDTTIPTPAASTRIDRIVLRKSWAGQTVRVTRIAGTEGAAAPALVQVAGTTWDLPLCQVSITTGAVMTITDQRAMINPAGVATGQNLIPNGGDEIAQRGTGPWTVDGAYCVDRRQNILVAGTSTLSVSQIASAIGSKGKSSQLTYVHVAGGTRAYRAVLKLIDGEHIQLRGQTITYSRVVKSTVAGTIRLVLRGAVAAALSAYNVGTGEETLTVTITLSATDEYIYVEDVMDVATATAEVNDAMLVIGSVAADYQPLTPADDLARCLRYEERHGRANYGYLRYQGYQAAGVDWITSVPFAVVKAVTPTLTKSGTWVVSNCGQPSASAGALDGYTLIAAVTGTGTFEIRPDSVDDYIEAVSNP